MERKRKLPARAAARVEHVAKKRTITPPERSVTPQAASTSSDTVQPPPEQDPLPRSVQAGKPLPTVEDAQPEDLPLRDYQNVQESGVLAESLVRSRQRWIAEGVFEKYWTKPIKRKGVVIEEPNNPPKESMSKLGPVTITIEPHIFEATLYAVKDPKPPPPPAPTTQAIFRPIMQYGPPNGSMPPPPTPKSESPAPPTPVLADVKPTPPPQSPRPTTAGPVPQTPLARPQSAEPSRPTVASVPQGKGPLLAPAPAPLASPSLAPGAATPGSAPGVQQQGRVPDPALGAAPRHTHASPAPGPAAPSPSPATPSYPPPGPAGAAGPPRGPHSRPSSVASTPAMGVAKPAAPAKPAPGTDPIIMTLAEKASEDPMLRDLMKRVAAGEAKQDELTNFQKIIDDITLEYKRKGGQQGPSADRLVVDGRTVKYFADEVRAILDIVLTTNPNQKSAGLLPPAGSDALVVALVKVGLDDARVRSMIRRIADNKPNFSDATDLKNQLDMLHKRIQSTPPPPPPAPKPLVQASPAPSPANGTPNGLQATQSPTNTVARTATHLPQQSLRSKGPPPTAARPDVTAFVFEFAGGNGDRYLFPKFSILEYLPGGHQVVASFLIVRKGSTLEYGGDAKLDYYQPVTVRLVAPGGRYLENLHRVVAPQDEVRRYMDDVMDNMTRAEYVLLAMRLPRGEPVPQDKTATPTNGSAAAAEPVLPPLPAESKGPTKPEVLWGPSTAAFVKQFQTREQYDEFVRARQKTGGGTKPARDSAYGDACSVLRLNEADFADYDKIIAGLAAKDDASAAS